MSERLYKQFDVIAGEAWKSSSVVQLADVLDHAETCLLAKKVVQQLINYSGPDQILRQVYFDQRGNPDKVPGVGITAVWEGTKELLATGGLNYISFETHPERQIERARDHKWLTIRGMLPEDGLWETMYTLVDSDIKKTERLFDQTRWRTIESGLPLSQVDIGLINEILLGIRDKVGSVLNR